jgi:hypothetical protein
MNHKEERTMRRDKAHVQTEAEQGTLSLRSAQGRLSARFSGRSRARVAGSFDEDPAKPYILWVTNLASPYRRSV